MTRVAVILELLKKHKFVMTIFEEETYENIFTPVLMDDWEEQRKAWKASRTKRPFTRVIYTKQGAMTVGVLLEGGKGKEDLKNKSKDPAMCLHPDKYMVMRGGKDQNTTIGFVLVVLHVGQENHWRNTRGTFIWSRITRT